MKSKIFIVGGSRFVGPLIIEKLLKNGHGVTVFNRGRIRQSYPEGTRFIKGDRKERFGIKEHFDAVVDMCAYRGEDTERIIKELRFDFLIHLSTAAVYKKSEIFPFTEESPLGDWPLWKNYNKGKVECELVLEKSGVRFASLRPVYILGPRNYCDRERFIYSRIKNGKPLILPGNGQARIQFVFAKDVAESIVLLVEKKSAGAFNCAGDEIITPRELVEEMGKMAGRKPIIRFNPVSDGEKFDVSEFPFANENLAVSNEKIKGLGIKFVPLLEELRSDYKNHYCHAV